MKISLSAAMSFLFITFCTILFVNVMNFNMEMQRVNNYHYATVHEIESSDFSPNIIEARIQNTTYQTNIEGKGVKNDLRIYEVKTSAKLKIPLLGYEQTYVKESIAR